jgi:hypothetical protein
VKSPPYSTKGGTAGFKGYDDYKAFNDGGRRLMEEEEDFGADDDGLEYERETNERTDARFGGVVKNKLATDPYHGPRRGPALGSSSSSSSSSKRKQELLNLSVGTKKVKKAGLLDYRVMKSLLAGATNPIPNTMQGDDYGVMDFDQNSAIMSRTSPMAMSKTSNNNPNTKATAKSKRLLAAAHRRALTSAMMEDKMLKQIVESQDGGLEGTRRRARVRQKLERGGSTNQEAEGYINMDEEGFSGGARPSSEPGAQRNQQQQQHGKKGGGRTKKEVAAAAAALAIERRKSETKQKLDQKFSAPPKHPATEESKKKNYLLTTSTRKLTVLQVAKNSGLSIKEFELIEMRGRDIEALTFELPSFLGGLFNDRKKEVEEEEEGNENDDMDTEIKGPQAEQREEGPADYNVTREQANSVLVDLEFDEVEAARIFQLSEVAQPPPPLPPQEEGAPPPPSKTYGGGRRFWGG